MMDVINTVEAKIKELQDTLQSHIGQFNSIVSDIEKLVANKANVQTSINQLQGAIQAFSETNNLIKSKLGIVETVANDVAAVVAPQAVPVLTAVESVVNAVEGENK